MKINPGWQPIGKNIKVNENVPPPQIAPRNFSDIMQQHDEKYTQEQLTKMVQQITVQGDRLSRGNDGKRALQYKLLIKSVS